MSTRSLSSTADRPRNTSCFEVRITGTDQAGDVGVPGALPPALSPTRPYAGHPEWDTVAWLDVVTFPTAPGAGAFLREVEQFIFTHYPARVEWSKGWAYSTAAAWTDPTVIAHTVPDSFRCGPDPTWDTALDTLAACDPSRLVTNPFLDQLLP